MDHSFSMLQIMNAALSTQGFDEIVAENDGSEEWRVLSRNWPLIVDAELEAGAYFYTREQVQLTQESAGKFGFSTAYLVPTIALHVRRLWIMNNGVRDTDIPWGQDGTHVHCDHSGGVFIEYMISSDPAVWGANFSLGVSKKLEAVLLRLKEEMAAAKSMDDDADEFFQTARTMSSKGRSATEPYKPSRFANARFRRG